VPDDGTGCLSSPIGNNARLTHSLEGAALRRMQAQELSAVTVV